MNDGHIKVRANKTTGELEVEGPAQIVAQWWEKLWPEVSQRPPNPVRHQAGESRTPSHSGGGPMPDLFGEFYVEFRSDITDVDKVLVAAAFVQGREQERFFTTKAANQALMDQNIKVTNASENVRRLIQTKRVFVVSDGKYRVSAGGFEHLKTLKLAD